MLLTIKRALAKNIGKNYELCYEAFQEGRKQGQILNEKYKAKAEEKVKEEPEVVYNEYSQTHTAHRDNPVEPTIPA